MCFNFLFLDRFQPQYFSLLQIKPLIIRVILELPSAFNIAKHWLKLFKRLQNGYNGINNNTKGVTSAGLDLHFLLQCCFYFSLWGINWSVFVLIPLKLLVACRRTNKVFLLCVSPLNPCLRRPVEWCWSRATARSSTRPPWPVWSVSDEALPAGPETPLLISPFVEAKEARWRRRRS